jgi:hypothetical protein
MQTNAVSAFPFDICLDIPDSCIDCGNALQNGGAPAPDGNAQCNMHCAGNTGEICGGPNRLNLYSYSASSTTTSQSSSPTATGNPLPGWTFLGCYTDSVNTRSLPNQVPVSGGLTNEGCQNACLAAGYSIAGTEYAGECCKCHSLSSLMFPLTITRVRERRRKWRSSSRWKCWMQHGLQRQCR